MTKQTMRWTLVLPVLLISVLSGCRSEISAAAENSGPQAVTVSTGTAVSRDVPASFDERGSFVAEDSSNIAPPVAGRIVSMPVEAGTFVKKGQGIAELDHRDSQLRLQQNRAQLEEATIAVQQAQVKIGLKSGTFDPNKVPEVAVARANYESAQAQAKLADANAHRYANLVETGDVSRSAFEQAQTQQETAEAQVNAARQQYEGALNGARQNYQAVSSAQSSLDGMRAQVAQAEKAVADTTIRAVATADEVKRSLTELTPSLPKDVHVQIIGDQPIFIAAAVSSIEHHLVIGSFFASIVIFLFLANIGTTLIASIAIPTSIIATFGMMAAVDFTLNQITMLALTLMVGVVIDDAIIVLENIYRFIEEKRMSPTEAAIEGTREIGLAVMATTLSLLAVFLRYDASSPWRSSQDG